MHRRNVTLFAAFSLFGTVLSLALAGCVFEPVWYQKQPAAESVTVYIMPSGDRLSNACGGRGFTACSRLIGKQCFAYFGPSPTACEWSHEKCHCEGWDHYGETGDCGGCPSALEK